MKQTVTKSHFVLQSASSMNVSQELLNHFVDRAVLVAKKELGLLHSEFYTWVLDSIIPNVKKEQARVFVLSYYGIILGAAFCEVFSTRHNSRLLVFADDGTGVKIDLSRVKTMLVSEGMRWLKTTTPIVELSAQDLERFSTIAACYQWQQTGEKKLVDSTGGLAHRIIFNEK